MLTQTLLKPPFLLLGVVGEELLLASHWDFVTPGPGCKQLTGTGKRKVFLTPGLLSISQSKQHHKLDSVEENSFSLTGPEMETGCHTQS